MRKANAGQTSKGLEMSGRQEDGRPMAWVRHHDKY